MANKVSNFSKFIVILIILFNITFTSVVLYIFFRTGYEPTALIAGWFAFTGGELWLLAGIKKKEVECVDKLEAKTFKP